VLDHIETEHRVVAGGRGVPVDIPDARR
jgi:hypothetical protein